MTDTVKQAVLEIFFFFFAEDDTLGDEKTKGRPTGTTSCENSL